MRTVLPILGVALLACGGSQKTDPGSDAAGASDGGGTDAAAVTRTDVGFSSDVDLAGTLITSAASPDGAPGVLLIHQFQRDRTQWGSFADDLARAGYRVLAFDLRGHGDSDPYDGNLVDLLTDPVAAPADMDAALGYLVGSGGANADRVAIVGTSIGANLAVSAAIRDLATTYVSLSSRESSAETYAGSDATGMTSVFYLAGENDGGNQAADALAMFDATAEPRRVHVYEGVSDHGIAILERHDDAQTRILEWLAETL